MVRRQYTLWLQSQKLPSPLSVRRCAKQTAVKQTYKSTRQTPNTTVGFSLETWEHEQNSPQVQIQNRTTKETYMCVYQKQQQHCLAHKPLQSKDLSLDPHSFIHTLPTTLAYSPYISQNAHSNPFAILFQSAIWWNTNWCYIYSQQFSPCKNHDLWEIQSGVWNTACPPHPPPPTR